ncbi:MAG: T9SS type A sorting domain-containing protein [Bacteroidales bacterium]|nr:T9SS type A sorting domain-containing protein [Bacteroidales bacterium]
MKKFYILLLAFVFGNISNAQDWQWMNPLPQGNTLNSVQFVNPTTAFAVGEGGTILKTTDGGLTWIRKDFEWNGTSCHHVFFTNDSVGFIAGEGTGGIWKTTNGGESWTLSSSGAEGSISSLYFVNTDTGYAVGTVGDWASQGIIYKTTDGGASWYETGGAGQNCISVFFTGPEIGYVVWGEISFGYYYTGLLKTSDGGASWITDSIGLGLGTVHDLYFTDNDTGFAIGGSIYKTTDGGITWVEAPGTGGSWKSVHFIDDNTGFMAGEGGMIMKTMNGGASWEVQPSGTDVSLNSINFADATRGIAVGAYGITLYTITGGATWNRIGSAVTFSDLNSVCFPDANTGYAVGTSGTIIKTSDAGNSWKDQEFPTTQTLYSIDCIDINTCYAVGDSGIVLKTINGGSSWSNIHSDSEWYFKIVQFPSSDTGYMIGVHYNSSEFYSIFRTTDGGTTWTINDLNTGYRDIYSMYFTDAITGYLAGDAGLLWKTTDGGSTWIVIPPFDGVYYSLFFTDKNTGYVCGNNLYKTTDGGITWNELLQGIGVTASWYRTIYFVDSNTGYMIRSGIGIINKTTDGGITWDFYQQLGTLNPQTLCFTSPNTGYVVGKGGSVLKTSNPAGINQITNNDFRITNYPNPIHQSTTFSYTLDEPGLVTLQIFDSFGRLVDVPVNTYQQKGKQQVYWNAEAFPSGIYFYRILAGNGVGSGKMIKL